MTRNPETTEAARAVLEAAGYVVVKAKSYEAAQRRQGIADSQRQWAIEDRDHTRRWAEAAFDEQRRLSDRLTFVYGVARARGATVEELSGPAAVLAVSPAVTGGLEVEFTKRLGERDWVRIKRNGIVQVEGFIANDVASPAVTAAEDETQEPLLPGCECGHSALWHGTDGCTLDGCVCRVPWSRWEPAGRGLSPAAVVAAVPAEPAGQPDLLGALADSLDRARESRRPPAVPADPNEED